MAIKLEDEGHNGFKAVREGLKYIGNIRTAYNEKKWWRFTALVILTLVMIATVILVKPILVAFLTKWFIGMGWLPLPVSKFAAARAGTFVTAQVGKLLKYWVLKIER